MVYIHSHSYSHFSTDNRFAKTHDEELTWRIFQKNAYFSVEQEARVQVQGHTSPQNLNPGSQCYHMSRWLKSWHSPTVPVTRGRSRGRGPSPPRPPYSLRCATWRPLPAGTAPRRARAPPAPQACGHQVAPGRAAPRPCAPPAPVAGAAVVSVNLLFSIKCSGLIMSTTRFSAVVLCWIELKIHVYLPTKRRISHKLFFTY